MTKKERYQAFVDYFLESFPEPETELKYNNPFELLVAVVLETRLLFAKLSKNHFWN